MDKRSQSNYNTKAINAVKICQQPEAMLLKHTLATKGKITKETDYPSTPRSLKREIKPTQVKYSDKKEPLSNVQSPYEGTWSIA